MLTLAIGCLKCVYMNLFFKMCKKYVGNNNANIYMHILRKELTFSGSDIRLLKIVLFHLFYCTVMFVMLNDWRSTGSKTLSLLQLSLVTLNVFILCNNSNVGDSLQVAHFKVKQVLMWQELNTVLTSLIAILLVTSLELFTLYQHAAPSGKTVCIKLSAIAFF
jgi:hypothetical protein